MARRAKKEQEGVSLFPFLSILACVIGVLTLMITAVALGQMDKPEGKKAEQYENYKKIKEQIEEDKEKMELLKQFLSSADIIQNAKSELQKLKSKKEQAQSDKNLSIKLLAEASQLRKRYEELEPEYKTLQEQINKLQAEMKRRKTPPEEARLIVRPGGSGVNMFPTFVECTQSGIVILEGKEPRRIRRADLAKDEGFLALLKKISETKNHTIIFLVRDDAVGTYNTARSVARNNYCPNGKLPLVGHGHIDLSVFGD